MSINPTVEERIRENPTIMGLLMPCHNTAGSMKNAKIWIIRLFKIARRWDQEPSLPIDSIISQFNFYFHSFLWHNKVFTIKTGCVCNQGFIWMSKDLMIIYLTMKHLQSRIYWKELKIYLTPWLSVTIIH